MKPPLSDPEAESVIALLASRTNAEAPGSGKSPGNSGLSLLSAQRESWSTSAGLLLPHPAMFVEGVLLSRPLGFVPRLPQWPSHVEAAGFSHPVCWR